MSRPNGRFVGSAALALLFLFALRPEAASSQLSGAAALPLAPDVPLVLEGCADVATREGYEEADCFQAIRLSLIEARIDLETALRELEACARRRGELAGLEARSAQLRADRLRAQLALGGVLTATEQAEYDRLLERSGSTSRAIDPASLARLRGAGIRPEGVTDPQTALTRLEREPALRAAFRDVYGDVAADDLEAILARDPGRAAAVRIGGTYIVPNLPVSSTVASPISPAAEAPAQRGESTRPLVVDVDAYAARLGSELRGIEAARIRYLASAARQHQRVGSVRTFLASLRSRDDAREEDARLAAEVERDRALMLTRLEALERRLGADPLIVRMAGESAGIAAHLDRGCQAQAQSRGRWIRRGAGLVTGLVGAAGVVVATGATGTIVGGITIAAALEATVGAYLVARSEYVGEPVVASEARLASLPTEAEERRFHRPEAEGEATEGEEGNGTSAFEEWFDDFGRAEERTDLAGAGVEEEGGEATEALERENRIPPLLPVDVAEELRELPPLLDTPQLREMRNASLPEIQERLDEFLALTDPAAWALASETDEAIRPISREQMIADARAALDLWATRRRLADGFGAFFIQAEIERLPVSRQAQVLLQAMGRYTHDRELLEGSAGVDDLRRRLAQRLVTHCRAGSPAGDLVLTACTEPTALSILLVAALRDAGVRVPIGSVLGVQAFGDRFEAVLYSERANEVYSLTRGEPGEGVVAPIYHPAIFYYGYLVGHGVAPEIDVDEHLLVALPDRPMPAVERTAECREDRGNVVGRAVEWLGSMVGVRRIDAACGEDGRRGSRAAGDGVDVSVSLPFPRNPLQRSGGGASGGGSGGGGGGGGTDPLASAAPRDAGSSGGGSSTAGGSSGDGGDGEAGGDAESPGGGEQGDGAAGGSGGGDGAAGADGAGGKEPSGAREDAGGSGADGGGGAPSETGGSGGSGGFGIATVDLPSGPDLVDLAGETVRMAERYERAGALNVMPWRLRDDEGMMTGSTTRVLYADNARALERFGEDDLFMTLAPAEVEAQRRMLEADGYPIYPAGTRCGAAELPPRKVFRRVAANDAGFRYVYCDQDETMVIFRDRAEAAAYAELSAPDRPLYLARLAARRMERFEQSVEVQRLHRFLRDPNTLREYDKEALFDMVRAAADLIVFQNALESALVQSMNELGPTEIRGYYYDLHRQVLQAPLFVGMAEGVHRLNRRLASDPLQSLAWANAQPELARQEFFDLYFTLGQMMEWPARWATLQQRYGSEPSSPPAPDPDAPSLDFLQILSDPSRVQVDWTAERRSDPSIRDRQMQDGVERTPEERAVPTLSDKLEMQDEEEHQRGGTGGLGRAGEGASMGPERGQRPIQMLHIRISPDAGDPDRQRLPDDNQVRPGGTEGRERRQTEESASRQEPMLWVAPETFVDGVLSGWDGRDLEPRSAARIPPVLRFNERLREHFLTEMHDAGVYDNRLRAAMEVFTADGWLRFDEVRRAMGGDLVVARARDTGRFSGAYSGNPPINDQEQIRIPNFFSSDGVIVPADLFRPVAEHYTRAILGIFELTSGDGVPAAEPLASVPPAPGEAPARARASLLRSLEMVESQASEW